MLYLRAMAELLKIHETHPQQRLISKACAIVRRGGVIIYPTECCYAIGCQLGDKSAVNRIRQIRRLGDEHHFTLACRDLSELAKYATVSNDIYRFLKAYTPGAYTFLLQATKSVPRLLLQPKRKTIGIRVPENRIAQSLLETLDGPLMSVTLQLPYMDIPLIEAETIYDMLGGQVDVVIDGGHCGIQPTSIVDLTSGSPEVIRVGRGETATFSSE